MNMFPLLTLSRLLLLLLLLLSPSLKNGVKLTASTNDWGIASTSFHSNLPISQISENDTEEIVKHFNGTVYNYFKDNFGLVDSAKEDERNFTEIYKNFTNIN